MDADIIMPFKLLYVVATGTESAALNKVLQLNHIPGGFKKMEMSQLCTGVGSIATAWALKQWITLNGKPHLAINAGIAGSFNDDLARGDVVMPVSDCFADSGIEDGDRYLTLHEAGFTGANEFPYRDGLLIADNIYTGKLKNIVKPVKAITVNTATGSENTRMRLMNKFNPDIETMEGATFFYICSVEKVPFLAFRAVSNYVEPRNREKWNIPLALDNLTEKLTEFLLMLY